MPWPGQTNEDARRQVSILRDIRRLKGICPACGIKRLVPGGKKICVGCRRLGAERQRAMRERRLAEGLCVRCGAPAVPGRTLCETDAYRYKLRREGAV